MPVQMEKVTIQSEAIVPVIDGIVVYAKDYDYSILNGVVGLLLCNSEGFVYHVNSFPEGTNFWDKDFRASYFESSDNNSPNVYGYNSFGNIICSILLREGLYGDDIDPLQKETHIDVSLADSTA